MPSAGMRFRCGACLSLALVLGSTSAFADESDVVVTDRGATLPSRESAPSAGPVVGDASVVVTDRGVPHDADGADETGEPVYGNALTVNPAGFLFGAVNADLGIALTPGVSLNLRAAVLTASAASGFGGGVGLQFFPAGKTFKGIFLYPFAQYSTVTVPIETVTPGPTPSSPPTIVEEDVDGSAAQVGGLLGYQFVWGGFTLRLGGGLMYTAISIDTTVSDVEIEADGVNGVADISIGAAF